MIPVGNNIITDGWADMIGWIRRNLDTEDIDTYIAIDLYPQVI